MHSILMDHGMNPGTVASPDVLVKWDPHAIGEESYDEICEQCKAVLQWGYHERQLTTWEKLPLFFGVDGVQFVP